ncbi:MAG TPA: TRAP transporter small permease subunit [Gammaproteobacteria bacterium]|nr:TRAP transporter small permease subunit [Gammaproteobacteria bacterium]
MMHAILSKFAWAVDSAARALFVVAGVMLTAMMLIITADVVTRSLFGMSGGAIRLTVAGGVELVRFALLFTIVCALPAVVERGQVVVESFTGWMSAQGRQVLFAIYLLGFCGFGVVLAYGWYGGGVAALRNGETTQDLGIPMAPLLFAAAACAAVLAVRSFICAVRSFAGKVEA